MVAIAINVNLWGLDYSREGEFNDLECLETDLLSLGKKG